MKRGILILLCVIFLTGCGKETGEMNRALSLRNSLQSSNGCSFDSRITADYGDKVYVFGLQCRVDKTGAMDFTVTEPESIAGITGRIAEGTGKLTFDDTALYFPLLADGQITPISGPWILMKTLLGGYLTAVAQEEDLLHLTIHDSYEEDALQMEIWLNSENMPVCGEILYDGRRIITMTVENFGIR